MAQKKRAIHFLTGKRGGWGAMVPTLRAIQASEGLELDIIATDMHAEARFGDTIDEIRDEGFDAWPFPLGGFTRTEKLADLAGQLAVFWKESPPDIVLLIGDRGESLVAAVVAQQMGLFIAHIEGGDVTGALDDSARHAITKLSHLHFAPYREAAARIIRMGEDIRRVHVVGDVHIDRLMIELDRPLEKIEWAEGTTIVLVHPDTVRPGSESLLIKEAIDLTAGGKRAFIYPCSDTGHEEIIAEIEKVDAPKFRNLPHGEFIMALRQASCLMGNSSACRREASYINGLDVIEIGWRQGERPQGQVYGDGRAHERIVPVLETCDLLIEKRWVG